MWEAIQAGPNAHDCKEAEAWVQARCRPEFGDDDQGLCGWLKKIDPEPLGRYCLGVPGPPPDASICREPVVAAAVQNNFEGIPGEDAAAGSGSFGNGRGCTSSDLDFLVHKYCSWCPSEKWVCLNHGNAEDPCARVSARQVERAQGRAAGADVGGRIFSSEKACAEQCLGANWEAVAWPPPPASLHHAIAADDATLVESAPFSGGSSGSPRHSVLCRRVGSKVECSEGAPGAPATAAEEEVPLSPSPPP
jgi:hypothetical protein